MRAFFYRVYQFVMKVMVGLLKIPDPQVIEGENSVLKVPGILKQHQVSEVLLVTDKNMTCSIVTGKQIGRAHV